MFQKPVSKRAPTQSHYRLWVGVRSQSHHLCDIERGHQLFIYDWLRLKLLPQHDLEMVSIFSPATSGCPWLVIFDGTEPQNVVEHLNADVKIYRMKNYQLRPQLRDDLLSRNKRSSSFKTVKQGCTRIPDIQRRT